MANLDESNRVKEKYIGLFLRQCSSYIDRMDSMRVDTLSMLKAKRYADLLQTVKNHNFRDRERDELLEIFDSTFIGLFPTFVDEFNMLLRPDCRIVPDDARVEVVTELDERLLPTPSLALRQSRAVACEMAECSVRALNNALTALTANTPELAQSIRDDEERCDHYEDILGTYLVKLSAQKLGRAESEESTELLKTIGDFERISDHAVNILSSAEEMTRKNLTFSANAKNELITITSAIREILSLALKAFERRDNDIASQVEPLEQVIDTLKEQMRTRHILRMQQGQCSIEAGFVLSDLLTDLERTSDHCSNIAGCIIDASHHNLNLHETLREAKAADSGFQSTFHSYAEKYQLPLPPTEQAL